MIYKCREAGRKPQTYQGFCFVSKPRPIMKDDWLLVCLWFDGEPDLFYIEPPYHDSMEELLRMHRAEFGIEDPPVQVWKLVDGMYPHPSGKGEPT